MGFNAEEFLSQNNQQPRKYGLKDIYDAVHFNKFEENVKKSAVSPFSEIMMITPERAKLLLERNTNNRTVNHNLVKTIASDIASGRWMLNGESVIISKDGELNDGQHRLLAVVLSQKPIQTLVFFGAERESRITVDMGKPRTVANLLSMDNITNCNNAAAITRLYVQYRNNRFQNGGSSNSTATKQHIREEYFANQEKIEGALRDIGSQKFTNMVGVTPMCVAYMAIGDVNTENRQDFFYKLIFGESIKAGNPILKAREHLIDLKHRKATAQQRMEAIFRYWNQWRRGLTMHRACSIYNEWPDLEA